MCKQFKSIYKLIKIDLTHYNVPVSICFSSGNRTLVPLVEGLTVAGSVDIRSTIAPV